MGYYSSEKIHFQNDDQVTLGCFPLDTLVALSLSRVPSSIVDDVFGNCRFYMPGRGERGRCIHKSRIKDKHLIFISRVLLDDSKEEQVKTVLHEIAHYVLGHLGDVIGAVEEIEPEENEADALVDKWLKDWKDYQESNG